MNSFKEGWYSELSEVICPGQCFSLEVDEIIYEGKSQFQEILMLKSKTYGKCLILDGMMQYTERDECSYQEMMAFMPLNSHPNPESVLIIGGGDCGVLREVLKHPKVKTAELCEIDQKVVDICRQHFPHVDQVLSNPKAKLRIEDGFKLLQNSPQQYDVIITDSSDPVGPAESLFTSDFYRLLKSALKPNGIVCSQGECFWLSLDLLKKMRKFTRQLFPSVGYAWTSMPTYPSGQIGLLLCSLNPATDFANPVTTFTDDDVAEMSLQYYNADVHRAACVLPSFVRIAFLEIDNEK